MFVIVVIPFNDTDFQVTAKYPVSTGWESQGLMF